MHKLALAGQAAIRTSAHHKAATVFSTGAEQNLARRRLIL